jgi:hypothetical protein
MWLHLAHHFVNMGGVAFQSLIVAMTRWSNLEGTYVWLCIMSSSTCWGQVDSSLTIVIVELCCMLCKQFTWVTTMLICDQSVGKVGIWYVLHHLWKKYWLDNGFVFNALRPRYLFIDDMDYSIFFSTMIDTWPKIWGG